MVKSCMKSSMKMGVYHVDKCAMNKKNKKWECTLCEELASFNGNVGKTNLVMHRPSSLLGPHIDSDTIDDNQNMPPMVYLLLLSYIHRWKEGMCLYLHKNIWREWMPQKLT